MLGRVLARTLRVSAHLLLGAVLALAVTLHRRSGREPQWIGAVTRWWYEHLCTGLGVEVRVSGAVVPNCLLVSNHMSWLDIPVLGAHGELRFLAKAEVRRWPLIGWLAQCADTIFIERGGHQVSAITARLVNALTVGRTLLIFPEGTTTDGATVARFHARLFGAAQLPGQRIQPVALRYYRGAAPTPETTIAYIGTETLLGNLWRVLWHPQLVAHVQFLPPFPVAADAKRRELAERAHALIVAALNPPNPLFQRGREKSPLFDKSPRPPFSKGEKEKPLLKNEPLKSPLFDKSPQPPFSKGEKEESLLKKDASSPPLKKGGWGDLNLAVVTETYPPEINGVANTMLHLVDGLAARGHQLHLVRPRQPSDAHQPPPSVNTLLVPGLPLPGYRGLRFGLPVYWRLRQHWSRTRPELIYIATQGPLGHAALAAARALNIPTVTGFHTQFQHYSQHYGLGLLMRPISASLRHFHNRSDMTLVPTAALQTELTASGFKNVQVFGRGVDVKRFSPAQRSAELRQAWGCDADSLVVIHVGRIAAEKNLELARAAFAAIQSEHPTAQFVLVGDGPEREHWQHTFPEVRCVGAKIGAELAAHYASGDLFLFPSLTETFGNVVTEAMASGLAVLAFDDAAAHAYIQNGINGITVPVTEPAAFIAASVVAARDRQRLRELGVAARRTAEHISWERVLGGLETHFTAVITQHGTSPN
jgi:1-acyl-sn-glycerol-3-phosphate acyltransferase